MQQINKPYKRKVLPFESIFVHTPGVVIGFIAGITGNVDETKFINAINKLIDYYPILRSKFTVDKNGEEWIEETKFDLPVRIVPRISDDHFKKIYEEATKSAIDLENGPFYEFILVKSEAKSEIIFRGHHMMTDGVAMVRILELILQFMKDPNMTIKVYNTEELPNGKILKKSIKPKLKLKQKIQNTWDSFLFPLINLEWKRTKLNIPKEDIIRSYNIYQEHFKHLILIDEFTEEESINIAKECKKHNMTVNSAMATAFLACRNEIDKEHENNRQFVSVDLRRYLGETAKQAINCYASTLTTNFAYDAKKNFWENAKNYHNEIKMDLEACAEAVHVKNFSNLPTSFIWATALAGRMYGVPDKYKDHPFFQKIGPHSSHVAAIFARISSRYSPAFTITNMGKAKFSYDYGDLKLDSCIISPSFVVYPSLSILLSVITVNNKITISFHTAKNLSDTDTDYEKVMEDIKSRYKEFLTKDIFK